jgi:hypothetical protein
LKIKIGFLNSNFKFGFGLGKPKAENDPGDATMRVWVCVWREKDAKRGANQTTARAIHARKRAG